MSAVHRGYVIADEPRPSGLAHLAVRPLWPLFAFMLGGAWIGWSWSAVNAHALGSPRIARTYGWLAAGALGTAAVVAAYHVADARVGLPKAAAAWFRLLIFVWKLVVAYALFYEQETTSELHAHFGRRLRNGAAGVAVALVLGWYAFPHIARGLASLLSGGPVADVITVVLE